MPNETHLTTQGLRLDAPAVGDIVTVRVKPRPKSTSSSSSGGLGLLSLYSDHDEADAPQHYRISAIWEVLAVNGGQAVVQKRTGYDKDRRDIWSIAHHEWFEASELLAAMEPSPD